MVAGAKLVALGALQENNFEHTRDLNRAFKKEVRELKQRLADSGAEQFWILRQYRGTNCFTQR